MILCKQCNKEKPEKEFPWLKGQVCHDCHMWNAMHWKEIPWPKKELSENQKAGIQKARESKKLRDSGKSLAISTEEKKTSSDTLEVIQMQSD